MAVRYQLNTEYFDKLTPAQLKEELKKTKIQLKEAISNRDQLAKEIENDDQFKKFSERLKEIHNEDSEVMKKMDKIRERIYRKYFDTDKSTYIYYTRNSYRWERIETNIKDSVLAAIEEVTGIRLSKLKASQIEEIVKEMVRTDLKNNKDYSELSNLHKKLCEEQTALWQKEDARKRELGISEARQFVSAIKRKEQHLEMRINHPKKFKRKTGIEEARLKAMGMIPEIHAYLNKPKRKVNKRQSKEKK
jgi:hypothetical protein